MTAQEAKNLVTLFKFSQLEDKVYEKIRAQSLLGKETLRLYQSEIGDDKLKELINNGYRVEIKRTQSTYDNNIYYKYYDISWSNE